MNFKTNNTYLKTKHVACNILLEKLPQNSVDVIITDPAYSGMNKRLKYGKGRIVGQYEKDWFPEFDDSVVNYRLLLNKMQRVLNKDGHLYIMFDSYSLLTLGHIIREFFDIKNIIVWDKGHIGMGYYYRRQHELIIFATNKNTRKINRRDMSDIWPIKRVYKAKYKTQKPVALFERMLVASCIGDMVVCDPFMGSGSSAIAAVNRSVNYIGGDISREAIDMANKRIKNYIKTKIDLYE